MSLCRIITLIVLIFINLLPVQATSVADFLPGSHVYLDAVPTPESSLGFDLGQRHPRHEQMLTYMQSLAQSSERVTLTHIGHTTEFRKQILLT